MKKRDVAQFLLFLLVSSFIVLPVSSIGEKDSDNLKKSDPSSPQFDWSNADYPSISDWGSVPTTAYSQIDWSKVPTTGYNSLDWSVVPYDKIPVENTGSIPKEKIDVNKVRDQSKLTSDQLLHNKNLNKIPNVGRLDEQVLGDVLSQHSGTGIQLQASDSGTKVILNDDGSVTFNKGNTLSIGDNINNVGIAGFTNARYADGFLSAESGSWATQKKNDEVLTTTQNFKNLAQDTKKNNMIVDSAQQIITRYSTLHNVKKTLITQKGDSTTIISLEKQDFTMNNNGEEIKVQTGSYSSITTSKNSIYLRSPRGEF